MPSRPDLKPLAPYLKKEAEPGPGDFFSIGADGLSRAAVLFQQKPAAVMARLLKFEVWPRRFIRNRGVMTADEQARLLDSRAVVIGCGGLGGYAAALLARIGLGAIILCDRDSFEESNLNRQLFCRETNLGRNKAEAAAEEIASIASHVHLEVWPVEAKADNLPQILAGSHIVMDCLDSIAARRQVEAAAHQAGLPFIHGSIAGEEGFALVTRPGGKTIASLYGDQARPEERNAERSLGVPTVTPAFLACLQVSLAVRELLGRNPELSDLHHVDLSVPFMETLNL